MGIFGGGGGKKRIEGKHVLADKGTRRKKINEILEAEELHKKQAEKAAESSSSKDGERIMGGVSKPVDDEVEVALKLNKWRNQINKQRAMHLGRKKGLFKSR